MSFHWPNSPEGPRPPGPATPMAWHYTGPDGLLGILSTSRFWASDPIVLNDRRELKYGLGVIAEEWRAMVDRWPPSSELRTFIDELLSPDWQESLTESVFIVSASRSSEIAAQWLNYANSDGFAIGFEPANQWWPIPARSASFSAESLSQMISVPPIWLPVDYEPDEQRRTARDLLGLSLEVAGREATPHIRDLLRMNVATGVATFKHPAFRAEEEIRLAVPTVGEALEFRSSGGRLIPYTEVAAYEGENGQAVAIKLPIKEIVCSPSTSGATFATVQRLLVEKGYPDVVVLRSELPLA